MRRRRRSRELVLVLALGAVGCAVRVVDGDAAVDGGATCTPGAHACADGTFFLCAPDGRGRLDVVACAAACDPEEGCVECVPGAHRCRGSISERCSVERTWTRLRDCDAWGSACGAEGLCEDECAAAEAVASYRGCDYRVTRLRTLGVVQEVVTALVANHGTSDAHVELLQAPELRELVVPAGTVTRVDVRFAPVVLGSEVGTADGVRLRSDRPITVTQFFPLDDTASTADASLLLPTHALGTSYRIVGYTPTSLVGAGVNEPGLGPATNTAFNGRNLFTVTALDEETVVEVVPTAPIERDAAGRVPAAAAGEAFELVLAPGETATILGGRSPICTRERPRSTDVRRECVVDPFGTELCWDHVYCEEPTYDLTGTLVRSDHPIAVTSGNDCAFVPFDRFACDRLEEQLPPIAAWGREHVSLAVGSGGGPGTNRVRIVAAFDGTEVEIEPPQADVAMVTLDAGEHAELVVEGAFRIVGTRPILVAQFLQGQGLSSEPATAAGDPSFWIVPPVEQYETDYRFALPESYLASENGVLFLLVVRPEAGWSPVGEPAWTEPLAHTVGGWSVGLVPIGGGAHDVRGTAPFSLVSIGLSNYTSFATPAGRGAAELVF